MNFLNKGSKAEKYARFYLRQKGFEILETNFRSKFGEIDIIAKENDILCFIEVKYRKNRDFGLPEEFVDNRKQSKIIKTGLWYLSQNQLDDINIRFDIVAVENDNNGKFTGRLIRNGFEANFE